MGTTPFEKRGPRAWDNYFDAPLRQLSQGGWTRLLSHSIGDTTALQWLPKVRDFLYNCQRQQIPLHTKHDIDVALGPADCRRRFCGGAQDHRALVAATGRAASHRIL